MKRLFKSKRGDVFITITVFLTLLLVGAAAFVIYIRDVEIDKTPAIGYSQTKLIGLYNDADKIIFYLDKSLQYIFDDSFEKLVSNGGFYDVSKKNKEDYVVWEWNNEKCYPTKEIFYENLGKFLNDGINEYWKNNGNYKEDLKYDFDFNEENGLKVKGKNVKLFLNDSFENSSLNYTFDADLLLKVDYNFDDLFDKIDKIKSTSSLCSNNLGCWQQNIDSNEVEVNMNGDFYTFKIKVKVKDELNVEKEVIFKGSIDYSDSLLAEKFVC